MSGFISSCVTLCAALVLVSTTAFAQPAALPYPELTPGEEVSGSLEAGEAELFYGSPFRVYRVEVVGGERYQAILTSSSFQPHLVLMRPVGGLTEIIRDDGFGDESGTARVRFRVDSPGTYILVVRPIEEGVHGPFSLRLDVLPPPEPATARPIALNDVVASVLSEDSPLYSTEAHMEVAHDLYQIALVAGQTVEISMESDEVDSFIEFGPVSDGSIQRTHLDDDGGEGLNSLLRVQIANDGLYGIVARSFGEEEYGSYTLRVVERGPRPVATATIESGVQQESALSDDDAELASGAYYQQWVYHARAGERVQIRMRSDEFDTFLYLGRVVDGDFVLIDENDDAPDDGTNSLIEHTFAESGEHVIRASSLWLRQSGAYTIEVDSE